MVTFATLPFSSVNVILAPLSFALRIQPPTVFTSCEPLSSAIIFLMFFDIASAATTWHVKTLVSFALFSGLSRSSTVPFGSAANASFVGANTVNGPLPFSVSTRSAAFTAATSVVWSLEFIAFSTMFLFAYIGEPPTLGFSA